MDAQRSIYPQRVRKKSVGQFRGLSTKLRESDLRIIGKNVKLDLKDLLDFGIILGV